MPEDIDKIAARTPEDPNGDYETDVHEVTGNMRNAILVPYAIDQNEPSSPLPRIYRIPDTKINRDVILKDIFNKYVSKGDPDDPEEIKIRERTSESDYGDVIVYTDSGFYLFVTFIEG